MKTSHISFGITLKYLLYVVVFVHTVAKSEDQEKQICFYDHSCQQS